MKKRFTHEVKIKELNLTLEFIGERMEFFKRQLMSLTSGFRTKHTIKVASVGYFKVTTCNHESEMLRATSDDRYSCLFLHCLDKGHD